MGNIFDSFKKVVFDTTTAVMGYTAEWVPSATPDAEPFVARVHYKQPNEDLELSGVEYMPLIPFMEYRAPHFPGLFEAVEAQNGGEIVTIEGRGGFHVKKVTKIHDGDTYKAILEPVDE